MLTAEPAKLSASPSAVMAGQAGSDDRGSLLAVIGDEVRDLHARLASRCMLCLTTLHLQ